MMSLVIPGVNMIIGCAEERQKMIHHEAGGDLAVPAQGQCDRSRQQT